MEAGSRRPSRARGILMLVPQDSDALHAPAQHANHRVPGTPGLGYYRCSLRELEGDVALHMAVSDQPKTTANSTTNSPILMCYAANWWHLSSSQFSRRSIASCAPVRP